MRFSVFLISLALALQRSKGSLIIQTQHGPVEGTTRTSDLGRKFFSFMGIPYGRPTEGALKFRVSRDIFEMIMQIQVIFARIHNCQTLGLSL
jgi:hypothetical protein